VAAAWRRERGLMLDEEPYCRPSWCITIPTSRVGREAGSRSRQSSSTDRGAEWGKGFVALKMIRVQAKACRPCDRGCDSNQWVLRAAARK
jgi:hypothetical protein